MSGISDKNKLLEFWLESAEKDFQTMLDLKRTGHNHWALFMGHLVIEKLAKALFVKINKAQPPLLHDLRRIIEKTGVTIEPDRRKVLDGITRFNLRARYDDYKHSFYRLCTDEFTDHWIEKIKESKKWIKSLL